MKIRLEKFKVYNFRSIEESDWVEVADNSCLVGTNEAGKTNLLIALWKLNPANGEPIVPLDDFPRHLYSNYKANNHSADVFIEADFILDTETQEMLAKELACEPAQLMRIRITRRYDGIYNVSFPSSKVGFYPGGAIIKVIESFENELNSSEIFIKESDDLRQSVIDFLSKTKQDYSDRTLEKAEVETLYASVNSYMEEFFGKKKNLPELFQESLLTRLQKMSESFNGISVATTDEIHEKIISIIPRFVYYSDYGNLDSEIYLPRVIEDFGRSDLSESARAKARTLNVLFKYVKLSPTEIFELGNESRTIVKKLNHANQVVSTEEQELSEEEIRTWADKKRERGILLRSAATQLTQNFKKWWMQGDYIFDFTADGRHFRINVSDSLRPEPIELEARSRGLQWFFSFFLVFLVETKEEHANTVLLLDEPGLSLHPIAQYDLAKFFRKLSEDNQLIYTSHSPFLIDMENLGNVKAVYVDSETGRTKVSANLRYNEQDAAKSIFPVHAALGLTVSDTLLLGCLPVLVEGPSDQIYLSMIKRYLVGQGQLKHTKEIVFIPTGGVRGMGPVTKLVSSRDDSLPFVLLDADSVGMDYQKQLTNGRYKEQKEKVLGLQEFLSGNEFEIEDLMPALSLIAIIDRQYRSEQYFEDSYTKGAPIVPQVESWAKSNAVDLQEGWKVDIARIAQNRFDSIMQAIPENLLAVWSGLFERLTQTR